MATTTLRYADRIILVEECPEPIQQLVRLYDIAAERANEAYIASAIAQASTHGLNAQIEAALSAELQKQAADVAKTDEGLETPA